MCTRTVFTADDGRVVTGRNMDWAEDMLTDLWAFDAGMHRRGEDGPRAFEWASVHASVIAAGYNAGTADGINDVGLVANLLYLAESDFGSRSSGPTLSVGAWAQYLLDTCGSVEQTVAAMRSAPFSLTAPLMPNGMASGLHLAVSDASGDSAIFEFVKGDLVVHHSSDYRVMTNSPVFREQLAINTYWAGIGGETMLPGTSRAADRFVRATYYLGQLPTDVDERVAAAGVLSVQRNASKPLTEMGAGRPEQSKTLWSSVLDSTALRYYFQDTLTPNIFWVDLKALAFGNGAASRRLNLQGHPVLSGEVSAMFLPEDPFHFLGTGTGTEG